MYRTINPRSVKKRYLFVFFKGLAFFMLWMISRPLFAQSTVEISGQIKGAQTGKNLTYCSVAVLNPADSLITGGITNDKGYFSIPVHRGRYKLVFRYVGYVPDTVNIGTVTGSKFLGIYKMKKDLRSLNEVEVKASSRESSIDKDTQIITEAMRKGAADAKDVLQKIPGLSYDRYNNTISVDNSSHVVFLVDGVEKNQNYIKNLAPERMKKVEIIRNPGGRYGLEGYSAIINIILRKDYQGQELFVNNQLLIDPDQSNSHYLLPQNRLDVNYNYSFKKLNIYAGINNRLQNFALKTDNETLYSTGRKITETPPTAQPNMIFTADETNYTLGADYYINPRNIISFESNLSNFPVSNQKTDQSMQTDVFDAGNLTDSFRYQTILNNHTNSAYNTLFYTGKLSNKDKINASFSYNYYHEDYDNQTVYENSNWRNEQGTNKKNSTKLNIEYNHTFNTKVSMQAGYDNTWKKLDNHFDVTGSDLAADTSVVFEQTETRHNVYGYLFWKAGKKTGIKAGLAVEYSHPVTADQNHTYFIYQPYADFKYDISKKASLKLMFRSDADYPSIDQTNPFYSQLNPTTISTGNPNLKPSVTNKISLRISIKQGLFSIEPYYYFSNNYISQTGFLRPDGLFEYTYSNIGHFEEKGIQTNFTFHFGKHFIWQNSFKFYNSKITYDNHENNISDWRANSQLVFTGLKNNGVIVLNYQRTQSKNINALGYLRRNNDFWLLLIQQPFLKNRLTVMAGYVLPVNWGVNYMQDNYVNADGYEKYNHTDISILKNMVILRISYRLSKGKVIKANKHIESGKENQGKGIF